MPDEISAVLVIEVLGRPAEHIASALEQLTEQLAKEKDVQLVNKKIYPPKPTEKMFITFAEVEIKASSLARLAELCFVYMPSSVEITKPYDLKMTLNDANALLNLLIARLHNYDAIAKRLTIENTILQNQLREAGIIKQKIAPEKKALLEQRKSKISYAPKSTAFRGKTSEKNQNPRKKQRQKRKERKIKKKKS